MPTKKKSRRRPRPLEVPPEVSLETSVEVSPGAPPGSGEDPPEVSTAFDSSPQDAYVVVKKHDRRSGWVTLTGRLSPEEATEEFIAENAGGGKYVLIEKVPTGRGGYMFGRQRTINVAGPEKNFMGWPTGVAAAPTGAAASPGQGQGGTALTVGGNNIQSIMEMGILQIFQQMQETVKMQSLVMQQALQPKAGVAELLQSPVIAELVVKLFGGNRDGINTLDVMNTAREIAALSAPKQTSEARSLVQQLQELSALKEVLGGLGGGGGENEGDVMTLAVRELLPVVKSAVLEGKKADAQRAAGGGPQMLQQYIRQLLPYAQEGTDAALVAQRISGAVAGSPQAFALKNLLRQPTLVEAAMKMVPEATPWKPWYAAVIDHLRQQMLPGRTESPEAPPPPRDGARL